MQKTDIKKQILTIPNVLSVFRLALIPVIVVLYVVYRNYTATTLLLALSGLTDVADGFIARRFNMVSDLGKAIDPVADKLTQVAMLVCLVTRFHLMALPLALLLIKEFFAGVTGLMMIKKTHSVHSAKWHGKLTTVLLYSTMLLHLLWVDIPSPVSSATILACTAMILISAVLYGISNLKVLLGKKSAQTDVCQNTDL